MKTRKQYARNGYPCDGCKRRCKENGIRFWSVTLGREVDSEGGVEPLEDWILKLYCQKCVPKSKPQVWWGNPKSERKVREDYGFSCDGCEGDIPEGSVMWVLNDYIEEFDKESGMTKVHYLNCQLTYCEHCMPGWPIVHWEPEMQEAA